MPILKSLNRANEVIEKIRNDIKHDKQCEGSTVSHDSLTHQMKELCRRFDIFRASVLKDYATKEDLKNIVIPEISLDKYSTTLENDAKYQPKGNYLTAIPDNLVTNEQLQELLSSINLNDYVTYQALEQLIANIDLESFITNEELNAKGYKTETEIRAIVDAVITEALNSEV